MEQVQGKEPIIVIACNPLPDEKILALFLLKVFQQVSATLFQPFLKR